MKITGIDQKKVEFPGVLRKISYGIPMRLGFLRGVTQFRKLSRDESLLSLEFLKVN